MSTETLKKAPKIETSAHPDFRVVHINAFFGGLSPLEGRITFYTDILEAKIKENGKVGEMEIGMIRRESQIDIRMSPMDFVNLAGWMNSHIKRLVDQGILKKEDVNRSKQSDLSIV